MAIDIVQVVAMFGIIVGVVWRTVFPWLKAASEAEKRGEPIKFEIKYFYSMVITAFVTIIIIMMAIVAYPIPTEPENLVAVFLTAFLFGMVAQSASNEVVDYMLA